MEQPRFGSLEYFTDLARQTRLDHEAEDKGKNASELRLGFDLVQSLGVDIFTPEEIAKFNLRCGQQMLHAQRRGSRWTPVVNWYQRNFSSEARSQRKLIQEEEARKQAEEWEKTHTLTAKLSSGSIVGWTISHPVKDPNTIYEPRPDIPEVEFLKNNQQIPITQGEYEVSKGGIDVYTIKGRERLYGIQISEYPRTKGIVLSIPLPQNLWEHWLLNTDTNSGLENEVVACKGLTSQRKAVTWHFNFKRINSAQIGFEAVYVYPRVLA